jgi:DNA-binding response OmpR family regulator
MNLKGKVALLAEDDKVLSILNAEYLNLVGFEKIFTAENGLIAQEIMRSQKIDFLFTDFEMPGLNGVELCQWAIAHSPGIKILFNSARPRENFDDFLNKYEEIIFIQKPFLLNEFLKTVAHLFQND